jgi:hypothetical protein
MIVKRVELQRESQEAFALQLVSSQGQAGFPRSARGDIASYYDTRRVFRFMKSIKMNCPSVIVLVK